MNRKNSPDSPVSRVASLAAVLAAALVLSSCGGGGSSASAPDRPDDTVITPPPNKPDLVVGSPSVSDSSPDAGASLTLRATVRNTGDSRSAATTLRYYRSSDSTISSSDTAVGTDTVSALATSGTSAESISLTAPSQAGAYYYGACVDTVTGESDTANNCSSGVRVTVSAVVDDHSDTRSGATNLSLGGSRSGRIETGSDVDYFRVRVSGSGTLTVHTTGSLDTVGELQSSSGSTLTSDDDGGSGLNFRIRRSVSAGTYYIKVESLGSSTGSYTVHASLGSGGSGRYGAIAVDLHSCSSYSKGIALNHSTSQDALNAAIRACQNDGGSASNCRRETASFRSCQALHYCADLTRCILRGYAGPTLRSVESRPIDSLCFFTHRVVVSGCNSN